MHWNSGSSNSFSNTRPTVFLTGSSGFLGAQVALQILRNTDAVIIALLRAPDYEIAQQRLRREWWDWPDLRSAIGQRVEVLPGDITLEHLGLSEDHYRRLVQQVTHIIHTAADIRLNAPLDELRHVNVTGTAHVLDLARDICQDHPLQRFSHVSTAYVSGQRTGPIQEDSLSDQEGFSTPYERSKYEAEQLVRQAASELPVTIFRPGMIVGDSTRGMVKAFNTLYYPLRLYLTGQLRIAPTQPGLRINLVPVDYVADAVQKLTFDQRAVGLTFHLTPPYEDTPTLTEFVMLARGWMRAEYKIDLPRPVFLPLPGLEKIASHKQLISFLQRLVGHDLAPLLGMLAYFQKQPVYLRENTDKLMGPYPHHWKDLLPPLLSFAVYNSFWRPTTRTVFEQILFRLQSLSKPIVYHDLTLSKDHPGSLEEAQRSAAEVRADILSAAAAIRSLGLRPGDRVAMIGSNSTRYFTALVASGLAGTVSVPIYPTMPLSEVDRLLKECQAHLFMVGSPDVLQHLHQIQFDEPVVSFCANLPGLSSQRPVLGWQEFLALGSDQDESLDPVDLDDPAALFFTSGTTGLPKAVIYRHEQFRWLARALASMFPWRERNCWGAYLSCLPVSHVVEGILSMYSPYYVPAALDIYFLEDFQAMAQALNIAHPTVFFSVPRFFEKVRAAFLQNNLAKTYLEMPENIIRKLLRKLLRRGLLRQAGLDGSRLMIVGSALMPPELLAFYKDLGIQVHNAYGLTEAPLVSVNRLGRNRIDTVGTLLPETQVRFGEDGEVQVCGPQVVEGYLENGQIQPFADGWFHTGDLGRLSADGYLTLHGRKKDILITAYGENIAPSPIEARLRAIPGVAEVLLVGDGRPYCIALFWMEDIIWNPKAVPVIETGVSSVNASLQNPARIKKWAVMQGSLTVANGCLSGSMKVKRTLVAERLSTAIDAIYRSETTPEIMHRQDIVKN